MPDNRQTSGLEDVLNAAQKVKGAAKIGKAVANIAKGAAAGGLAGAAAEAVKSFKRNWQSWLSPCWPCPYFSSRCSQR